MMALDRGIIEVADVAQGLDLVTFVAQVLVIYPFEESESDHILVKVLGQRATLFEMVVRIERTTLTIVLFPLNRSQQAQEIYPLYTLYKFLPNLQQKIAFPSAYLPANSKVSQLSQ